MLSDASEAVATGVLRGPKIDISILVLVDFVEEQLAVFSQKYSNSRIKNEKGLTDRLFLLLQSESIDRKHPFIFDKDYPENPESGQSPSPDLGVIDKKGVVIDAKYYSEVESFFSFEAKILGIRAKSRQKEYVIGSQKINGGIERFKKGIHGPELRYGGMLGYVQKHDFNHWHTQVNGWIEEQIQSGDSLWNEDDKLLVNNTTTLTGRYESSNSRTGNTMPIILFHLWVLLNNTPINENC